GYTLRSSGALTRGHSNELLIGASPLADRVACSGGHGERWTERSGKAVRPRARSVRRASLRGCQASARGVLQARGEPQLVPAPRPVLSGAWRAREIGAALRAD